MLARLISRWRSPRTTAAPAPDATPPAPLAVGATAAEPVARNAAPVPAWHLLARRPAIDPTGAIAGWELRLSDWAVQRLARSDARRALQETYGFALTQAARSASEEGRRPLVSLLGLDDIAAALGQLPPGTILLIDSGSGNPAGRLADHAVRLKACGIRTAAAPSMQAPLRADFALLDAAQLGSAEVLRRCRAPAPATGGWIAMNLATFDEVADAVRHRAALAYGRLSPARAAQGQRTLAPPVAAMQVAAILTALLKGRPPRELAEMFKSDVTLSYRLLRYLSLAGVGQGRQARNLQDAVMLLGANELHRWLCVLLADCGNSPIARALHETALTRGRLLESLAAARREPNPEALFVLGAFSLLDLLLNVPLEVALALTPVPEPAVDALIAETGPWRPYLEAALALEACDPDRLDAACGQLGLEREAVVALHGEAARWSAAAASLFTQADGPRSPRRDLAAAT